VHDDEESADPATRESRVVVGLIGWLTTHFDVAFDDRKTREGKETVRRVGRQR
jgi:hypothetical protein